MDSVTDTDIDRIFIRLQSDIDLSKIDSKGQLQTEIASVPKNRSWNKKLNDFYWNRIDDERKDTRREIEGATTIEELGVIGRPNLMSKKEFSQLVKEQKSPIVKREIEGAITIEQVENINVSGIKGAKREKEIKLSQLESHQRAEVRARLINEVMGNRNVSESEAEKIVTREKLVSQELGEPKY